MYLLKLQKIFEHSIIIPLKTKYHYISFVLKISKNTLKKKQVTYIKNCLLFLIASSN